MQECVAAFVVGHVDLDCDAVRSGGRARAGEVAVEASDAPTVREQAARGGGADSARGAGHGDASCGRSHGITSRAAENEAA